MCRRPTLRSSPRAILPGSESRRRVPQRAQSRDRAGHAALGLRDIRRRGAVRGAVALAGGGGEPRVRGCRGSERCNDLAVGGAVGWADGLRSEGCCGVAVDAGERRRDAGLAGRRLGRRQRGTVSRARVVQPPDRRADRTRVLGVGAERVRAGVAQPQRRGDRLAVGRRDRRVDAGERDRALRRRYGVERQALRRRARREPLVAVRRDRTELYRGRLRVIGGQAARGAPTGAASGRRPRWCRR